MSFRLPPSSILVCLPAVPFPSTLAMRYEGKWENARGKQKLEEENISDGEGLVLWNRYITGKRKQGGKEKAKRVSQIP